MLQTTAREVYEVRIESRIIRESGIGSPPLLRGHTTPMLPPLCPGLAVALPEENKPPHLKVHGQEYNDTPSLLRQGPFWTYAGI